MAPHNQQRQLEEAPWCLTKPSGARYGDGDALPNSRWGMIEVDIAASTAETNTLARPTKAGLRLAIVARSVGSGGSRVITVTGGIDLIGTTTITLDGEGEMAILESIQTSTSGQYRWRQTGPSSGT